MLVGDFSGHRRIPKDLTTGFTDAARQPSSPRGTPNRLFLAAILFLVLRYSEAAMS
jgi:hypothetical protein